MNVVKSFRAYSVQSQKTNKWIPEGIIVDHIPFVRTKGNKVSFDIEFDSKEEADAYLADYYEQKGYKNRSNYIT
ncbi:MAG: hypothetical protein V1690_00585 [Candidatus Moraniibacteriota bacterium]